MNGKGGGKGIPGRILEAKVQRQESTGQAHKGFPW